MTTDEIIDKWEHQLATWRTIRDSHSHSAHTRTEASMWCMAIDAFLIDLKNISNSENPADDQG